jgi:hypothetical protein
MDWLSGLVLVLLTLVGYSSGSVLAGRGRSIVPGLFDAIVVLILWAMALASRPVLGRWTSIILWLLIGALAGALLILARRSRFPKPRGRGLVQQTETKTGLGAIWQAWMSFSHEMGDFQGRILLIFFYFVVVTPFALLVVLFSDPLRLRNKEAQTYWLPRPAMPKGLEEARRQF